MYIRNVLVFLVLIPGAFAQNVVVTLPEFAWAVKKLAPKVKVESLLEGTEDPHFVDASPGFIFRTAKADLVIVNGMALEEGWIPKVLEQSGNKKVQLGSKGHCDASEGVTKIEALDQFDRSMGDVHPEGNPHYTLSIPRMIEAMATIKGCLRNIGVAEKTLNENFEKIKKQMQDKHQSLKQLVKSNNYYVYHREFNYLQKDYGLNLKESLEKIPGVLPSASYLATMATKAKKDRPQKVLASSVAPDRTLEKFEELSGVGFIKLQLHPSKKEDYLDFVEKLTKKIVSE